MFRFQIYVSVLCDVGPGGPFVSSNLPFPPSSPLDASSLHAVPIYASVDLVGRRQSGHGEITSATAFVSTSGGGGGGGGGTDEWRLEMADDGLVSPDVERGDGTYSQYLFNARAAGVFYEARFEIHLSGGLVLYRSGPSFYLSAGIPGRIGEDRVPPSRVTDFSARTFLGREEDGFADSVVQLSWTAPGDNLNDGRANYYHIFCGFSPSASSLSWDDCDAFSSSLVRFAAGAGAREAVNLTVHSAVVRDGRYA